jgi:hypothetical protein
MYSFTLKVIALQEQRIQRTVKNVVSRTRSRLIPSMPNL